MSEKAIPVELRRMVTTRARHCCEYCRTQSHYSADPLTIDHITPRSVGGPTVADNLALCCHGCNQHKARRISARDAVTDSLVSLFNPRTQSWEEHFTWNQDFTLMLGMTPAGRATIAALQLNRSGLVNLRRVLYMVGEHPPKPQNAS